MLELPFLDYFVMIQTQSRVSKHHSILFGDGFAFKAGPIVKPRPAMDSELKAWGQRGEEEESGVLTPNVQSPYSPLTFVHAASPIRKAFPATSPSLLLFNLRV